MILLEYTEALINEAEFSAARSSGAGGQHVNKVSTKIELRFNVSNSNALDERQKEILLKKLKNKINNEGELILTCQTERSQYKNRALVAQKFIKLLEKALKPVKKRKKSQPTIASKLKRAEQKRRNALKKELRKRPEL